MEKRRKPALVRHRNPLTLKCIEIRSKLRHTEGCDSKILLAEDISYLPKTIVINLPASDKASSLYLCVGIEDRDNEEVKYSSDKFTVSIQGITMRLKEIIVKG
ncbi:hypothetical protein I4U23_002065 [Adineta vaga]|nr:hypothetical protein I4U23_002065 [Adineta vaga]